MLCVEARTELGGLALDVELRVPAGACLALSGPSGAGKTTILRIVAGLLRPHSGTVSCAGQPWLDTRRGIDRPPEARRVGFVFQDYALFGHLRSWQNVAFPLRGLSRRERRSRAMALLERLGLGERAQARPAALSGGERQRVALARALAREPAALLLDEPLAALDARSAATAGRELQGALRDTDVPTLLVTHDFAQAARLGDRVAVIDAGRVVQEGTPDELAARPRSAFVADLAGAVVLDGVARPGEGGLTRIDLDGGGSVFSTDAGDGPVAVSVFPWEIEILPAGPPPAGSARNHLEVEVLTVTTLGNRARVALTQPGRAPGPGGEGQSLVAEVSADSAQRLGLAPGQRVTASWKAAATRLSAAS